MPIPVLYLLLVLTFEPHGLVGLLAVAHTVRQSNQILHVTELRERSRDCLAKGGVTEAKFL